MATQRIKRRFYSDPPWWPLVFALFTLLLALIVALALRKKVDGALPGCEACTADRRRFIRRVWVGWGVSLCLFVLAIAVQRPPTWILWVLVQVVVLVESFRGDHYRVQGKVSKDGQWVELRGADEHFVRQLAQGLATAQLSAASPAVVQPASTATHVDQSAATSAPGVLPPTSGGAASLPAAGWYPDPSGAAALRYWDGQGWTTHTHNVAPGTS